MKLRKSWTNLESSYLVVQIFIYLIIYWSLYFSLECTSSSITQLVEKEAKKILEPEEVIANNQLQILSVNTDDENDEEEYESWKQRELKRIKRDRDEREQ